MAYLSNEKASTGSSPSLDPTIEVEQAATTTTADAVETTKSSASDNGCVRNKKRWIIGAALAALVIFVIVFPAVYVTNKNNQQAETTTSADSTATTTTTTTNTTTATTNATTDGNNSTTVSDEGGNGGSANASSPLGLPVFNQDIMRGYENLDDLERDVELAAWFTVEQVVRRNNGVEGYESVGYGGRTPTMGGGPEVFLPGSPAEDGAEAMPVSDTASSGSTSSGTSSDFDTNNNADEVEEGDVIVSDGNLVYAAFGGYLLIWNPHTGTMVAQIKMPEIILDNQTSTSTSSNGYDSGMPVAEDMPVADSMPYYWLPQPEIRSMMLHQGRLLLIVQGNGQALMQQAGLTAPVFYDGLNTQLRIYDTAALENGDEEPISIANVLGSFVSARLSKSDGNVHLMTLSGVDTYTYLGMPLERVNAPETLGVMSTEDYSKEVHKIAKKTAVPQFVEQFLFELGNGDSGLPNLVRLSLFQNEHTSEDEELRMFPTGVVNNLALVHSFNMMSNLGSTELTSAGAFLPSYWAQFYMSLTTLIIAGQGQQIDSQTGYGVEATNFLAFSIQGATAVPTSVGSIEGYVVNDRALNVKGDHLRVAVSINNRWFIEPMPLATAEDTSGTTDFAEPESSTENYMIVLSLPGLNGTEPGVMAETGRVKLGKPDELIQTVRFYPNDIAGDIAFVVTFEQTDPLYVLDMANPTEPKILGELEMLGFSGYLHRLSNASLLGVGSAADATGVTTGTKITLYNVQNITEPYIVTEYVKENEENGYGYSAAVDDPKAGRYVPEMNTFAIPFDHSISDSNYMSTSRFTGYLTFYANDTSIIQTCENGRTYNETYYVGTDTSPIATSAPVCYYCAYMSPRAMIFNGKLMMIYNNFIGSYDIETCEEQWTLNVAIQENPESGYGCCGQYGYY